MQFQEATGGLAALFASWVLFQKPDISMTLNGVTKRYHVCTRCIRTAASQAKISDIRIGG